jgi:hypothetical protein
MNRLFEAIANDEVLSVPGAELGITRRKVSRYLGLLCFLLVIYWATFLCDFPCSARCLIARAFSTLSFVTLPFRVCSTAFAQRQFPG